MYCILTWPDSVTCVPAWRPRGDFVSERTSEWMDAVSEENVFRPCVLVLSSIHRVIKKNEKASGSLL